MSEKSQIISIVEQSLREHPEDWADDSYIMGGVAYEVKNKKLGLRIWVANKRYGLEITGPGFRVGGVALSGSFMPWRRRIMRLCRQHFPVNGYRYSPAYRAFIAKARTGVAS